MTMILRRTDYMSKIRSRGVSYGGRGLCGSEEWW